MSKHHISGFPKIRGTFLRIPIIRIIVFGGLYWGPLFRETTILCFLDLTTVQVTSLCILLKGRALMDRCWLVEGKSADASAEPQRDAVFPHLEVLIYYKTIILTIGTHPEKWLENPNISVYATPKHKTVSAHRQYPG